MTGEEVLALARSHGVRIALALGDPLLEADDEPPVEVVDALRDHKQAVVAELSRIVATAGEWSRIFGRHVATVMRVRNLRQAEAERAAYDIVLVEFLNATHPDTDPNRCARCGKRETRDATLLPFGVGIRHAWLHPDSWAPWRERRWAKAEENLAHLGIAKHHNHRKEPLMSNIELSIPDDLTAAQIIRASPSINEEAAQKLAAELHDIVACMQKAFALQPPNLPIEESDAIQTVLRTAVGIWPADMHAAADESMWVAEQITRAEEITGANDLYKRYLSVCGVVEGVDYASLVS
jgi:hypothetical protein